MFDSQEVFVHYDDVVAEQSRELPELKTADQVELLHTGQELIDRYEIQPALFEDQSRGLVFTSIAKRLVNARATTEFWSLAPEEQFVDDALALLARGYSPVIAATHGPMTEMSAPADSERIWQLHHEYTDEPLSYYVRGLIAEGILGDVMSRLGITLSEQDPYEVHVLTVGDPNSNKNSIIPANMIDWPRGELAQRTQEFLRTWAIGYEDLPGAWVFGLGQEGKVGSIYLPVSATLDSLKHEISHTQGGLFIQGTTLLGISVEERRADYFSGRQKTAYDELEIFFDDLAAITGFNLIDTLNSRPKGGQPVEVYHDIAAQIGLNGMLETVLLSPEVYHLDRDHSKAGYHSLHNVYKHMGGYEGVIHRLINLQSSDDAYQTESGQAQTGAIT